MSAYNSSSCIRPLTTFLAILITLNSTVAAKALWIEFEPVSSQLNATDDFLIPLAIGAEKQVVNLIPSLKHETFVIGPASCTPKGSKKPTSDCILYRGGVYDETKSTSFNSKQDEVFSYQNPQFRQFSNGTYATDSVYLNGDDDDWALDSFSFGQADKCNLTSGMLGLGKDSTILKRLVDDGKISSHSFGLHVGIDIWNHPWPVLNPSFDESGHPPTDESDFESGNSKRDMMSGVSDVIQTLIRRQDDEEELQELPKRESHKFPGSLTFGGYDKSKISPKSKPLTVPIDSDGLLKLSLTDVVIRNAHYYSPFDVVNKTYSVIIDPDTPYMHFPDTFSRQFQRLGGTYGDPGQDWFFTPYVESQEEDLGNVTMTFKTPDGKGSVDIVIPPTVFFQPVGYLRDFKLAGNDEGWNYYSPLKEFRGEENPIILGRSFLKAAYLFVNWDSGNFQLSQVAYTNNKPEIVEIQPDQNPSVDDESDPNAVAGDGSDPKDGKPPSGSGGNDSDDDGFMTKTNMMIIAGAAVALISILIVVLVCIRRRKASTKAQEKVANENNRNSDVALVNMTRPGTAVTTATHKDDWPAELHEKTVPIVPELPSPVAKTLVRPPPNTFELDPKNTTTIDTHELPNTPPPVSPNPSGGVFEVDSKPVSPLNELPATTHTPIQELPVAITALHPAMYPKPTTPVSPQQPGMPMMMPSAKQFKHYPPPAGPPPAERHQQPPQQTIVPAGYVPPPPPPVGVKGLYNPAQQRQQQHYSPQSQPINHWPPPPGPPPPGPGVFEMP